MKYIYINVNQTSYCLTLKKKTLITRKEQRGYSFLIITTTPQILSLTRGDKEVIFERPLVNQI